MTITSSDNILDFVLHVRGITDMWLNTANTLALAFSQRIFR